MLIQRRLSGTMASKEIELECKKTVNNIKNNQNSSNNRISCVFDLGRDYFDGATVIGFDHSETLKNHTENEEQDSVAIDMNRWTCNTCSISKFASLEDQRFHFKSDFHRFNVKRRLSGRNSVSEEEFEKSTQENLSKDDDVSSISGSDDEDSDEDTTPAKPSISIKNKLLISLPSGKTVSVWKSLLLGDKEELLLKLDSLSVKESDNKPLLVSEEDLVQRLKSLVQESQVQKGFRVVLLASGGHFAGCVFSGSSVVAHKTFHRYVVRAKAGGRQSTKDGTGKAPKSAGASLRRYNEMSLKKEILELLAAWKSYLDSSSCIYIFAPSINYQIIFGGENAPLTYDGKRVRRIPFAVRRPTLKEAKRIHEQLTSVYNVERIDAEVLYQFEKLGLNSKNENIVKSKKSNDKSEKKKEVDASISSSDHQIDPRTLDEADSENASLLDQTTPLHEASKSGNVSQILELLEGGCDPTAKDGRGRTAYVVAADKESRNVFRRFMAANPEKWDWQAANVPSPLTQEMEESQAAKQAEKNAKRKAKAKELKKQQKAKQKAQAQSVSLEAASLTVRHGKDAVSKLVDKGKALPNMQSKAFQEDLQKVREIEREKRAAAAEKRLQLLSKNSGSGTSSNAGCSFCGDSLAGKIPFHRYNHKYCSTTCMFAHSEELDKE